MLRVWVRFRALDTSLQLTVMVGSVVLLSRVVNLLDGQPIKVELAE